MKNLNIFSRPTAPRGKFTRQDLISSLIRLGIALLMATGVWMSTDLSAVLGTGGDGAPYLLAVVYGLGDLIQTIARQAADDQKQKSDTD